MLRVIQSEWLRARALAGTWVFLGLIVVSFVLPAVLTAMAANRLPEAFGVLSVASALSGLIPALLCATVFSTVRVGSERSHNLHAQTFMVTSRRSQYLGASFVVNAALVLVASALGIAGALVALSMSTAPLLMGDATMIGWVLVILFAGSLIGTSLGVIVPSVAGAVATPLLWVVGVEFILTSFSANIMKLADFLPFSAAMNLIGETAFTSISTGQAFVVVAAWTGALVAVALYLNEARDVK